MHAHVIKHLAIAYYPTNVLFVFIELISSYEQLYYTGYIHNSIVTMGYSDIVVVTIAYIQVVVEEFHYSVIIIIMVILMYSFFVVVVVVCVAIFT